MASFALKQKSWISGTENIWTTKPCSLALYRKFAMPWIRTFQPCGKKRKLRNSHTHFGLTSYFHLLKNMYLALLSRGEERFRNEMGRNVLVSAISMAPDSALETAYTWGIFTATLRDRRYSWNSSFRCLYLSFSPLVFASLLFTAIGKASPDSHFSFLHFFSVEMVLIPVFYTMSRTTVHSSSGTLSIRSSPLNLFLTSTV